MADSAQLPHRLAETSCPGAAPPSVQALVEVKLEQQQILRKEEMSEPSKPKRMPATLVGTLSVACGVAVVLACCCQCLLEDACWKSACWKMISLLAGRFLLEECLAVSMLAITIKSTTCFSVSHVRLRALFPSLPGCLPRISLQLSDRDPVDRGQEHW